MASWAIGTLTYFYIGGDLLAYALIDGIAGILVQSKRTLVNRFIGVCYATMIASHFLLFAGFISPMAHFFTGNAAGWGIVLALFLGGLNGQLVNRISDAFNVRRSFFGRSGAN